MRRVVLIFCVFAVACAATAAASPKRGLEPNDYYAMRVPSDPQISPDASMVAFTVTTFDHAHDRKHSEIWIAPLDGSRPARAFATEADPHAPRWSPDGTEIAFMAGPGGNKTQIYELPMSGGDRHMLTSLANGVRDFEWSPDGRQIACISSIGPADHIASDADPSDEEDYVYPEDKLDEHGYYTSRRTHIWVLPAAGGDAKQITFGDQENDSEPQWSPDGTRIAYLAQRTDEKEMTGYSEIDTVPAEGGKPLSIGSVHVGLSSERWSPDGANIAYVGSTDTAAIPKIWIAPAIGGASRLVSNTVTYPADLRWSEDSEALYYKAPWHGEQPIYRIDARNGRTDTLVARLTVSAMTMNRKAGVLAYIASDDTHPAEIFTSSVNRGPDRQVTHLDAALLDEVRVQSTEPFFFRSVDGWEVQGFFTKPLDWQAGKKYPMILMVHGGPNGMWGPNWNTTVQCFAARGWAVLRINPRGSSGYGEAFQRGVDLQWGGKAYQDLMNGVDAALARYPWVDPQRLGVSGHSYGGFMTDWIISQTTRFHAAVAQSGISDLISDDGARDAFYGHARDFGGDIFQNFPLYWKYSAIHYASQVKTPTLFLHGSADMRVPLEQAEEYFRALQHFGVPSELVIFPGEPHSVGHTPRHIVDWLRWQIYWFDRWIDGNVSAVKPITRG